MCVGCSNGPKATYRKGFRRESIVCDKAYGLTTLSLYCPSVFTRFIYQHSQDTDLGYIKYECPQGSWYYCSLLCISHHMSMKDLMKEMNDYDRIGILSQFKDEFREAYKKQWTEKQITNHLKKVEDIEEEDIEVDIEVDEEVDEEDVDVDEMKELKEELKEYEKSQSTLTFEIEKLKKELKRLKDNRPETMNQEIERLKEALKAKDREIFRLTTQNMELETKIKGLNKS